MDFRVAVGRAGGFVEGSPGDDGWMIEIAHHHLAPLALVIVHCLGLAEVQAPVAELAPGQVAESIGPVVEALFEDLLVQAGAVEADGLGALDVGFEFGVGGSSPDTPGVETLVEDEAQEDRFVVEEEFFPLDVELAQAGVRGDLIDYPVAVEQFKAQLVKMRIGAAPGVWMVHLQGQGGRTAGGSLSGGDFSICVCQDGPEGLAVDGVLERWNEHEAGGVQVGEDADGVDAAVGHGFEPDGLPDAGGAGVVTAARVQVRALFTAGLQSRAHVIPSADDQLIVAVLQRPGDVEAEGGAAAVVAADELAVDPGAAVVVDGAEVEKDALVLPGGGNVEGAMVPDGGDEVGIGDAGEVAFGAEGDGDFAVEGCGILVPAVLFARKAEVQAEVPGAVEVEPAVALELGGGDVPVEVGT